MTPRIHETAIVEADVTIGEDSTVWDNAHIRRGASIGAGCIIGDKAYVGPGVVIDDLVKLNTSVYLCSGVSIGRGAMISAHVVFTNDRFPRATDPELESLRSSLPDDSTVETRVGEGATIGAASVIGPGAHIGRFAMVGMGSVVTRPVGDFHLSIGSPSRTVGYVCRCGHRIAGLEASGTKVLPVSCSVCGRKYTIGEGVVREDSNGPLSP